MDLCCSTIYKRKPFEVEDITADMVQESFSRTKESSGVLDGWNPKELSMLSYKAYGCIARVVFLEKMGATAGQVMSYRPLTITSALYRCWGALRLKSCEPWIR